VTNVESPPQRPSGAIAGVAIAVAALLTLISIAHHPTVHALKPAEAIPAIVAMAPMDRLVHAIVIAAMAAQLFGFAIYSLRRGLWRQSIIGALIAYSIGAAAIVAAALIDGFLVSGLAERYAAGGTAALTFGAAILQTCALAIQIATKLGLIATSIAIVLWSIDLIPTPGALRAIGIFGVVAGIAGIALTAVGGYLNPHSLLVIEAIAAFWNLAIATLLVRGRV